MIGNYRTPLVRVGSDKLTQELTVKIGNGIFEGWKGVSVTRTIRSLAGSFSIEASDQWKEKNDSWDLKPGEECAIAIGGGSINKGRVLTGWINTISPSFSKQSSALPLTGYDKTIDIVQCDAVTVAGKSEFKEITLARLATIMADKFDIKVLVRGDTGKPFKKWVIRSGETCFQTLDRAARVRQVILTTSPVGNLILEKRGQDRSTSNLEEGINAQVGKGVYTHDERYSEYHVKGQMAGTDQFFGKAANSAHGIAYDKGVERYRPTLIIADTPVDAAEAQTMAEWIATVKRAEAAMITVTTPTWLQEDGRLWQVNEIMSCHLPSLGIHELDLLIARTTFSDNKESGRICTFGLVDKDAYKPNQILEKKGDITNALGWKV